MRKVLIPVLVIVVLIGFLLGSSYNSLVSMEEGVDGSWAQVENVLKRRADLIPNLIETVKGYASHEEKVLREITEARSRVQASNTPEEYAESNEELNQAIDNLNIVVENYPELKANENFSELQAELASTENKISTERMRYNEAVQSYNGRIRRFPTNIIAGIFNFDRREYFEISGEDAEVPEVDF